MRNPTGPGGKDHPGDLPPAKIKRLKKEAIHLPALVSIGKKGVTPSLLGQIDEILEAHELLKIKILKNCPVEIADVAPQIAEKTKAHLIQTIGKTFILYRVQRETPDQ